MTTFSLEIPNVPQHLRNYVTAKTQADKHNPGYKKIVRILAVYFSEVGVDFKKHPEVLKLQIPARHYAGKQLNLQYGGSLKMSEDRTKDLLVVLEAMFMEEFYMYLDCNTAAQHKINKKVDEILADQKLRKNVTRKSLTDLRTSNIIKPEIELFMEKYSLVGTNKTFDALNKAYFRYRTAQNPCK